MYHVPKEELTVQCYPDAWLSKANQTEYDCLKCDPTIETAEPLGEAAMVFSDLFGSHSLSSSTRRVQKKPDRCVPKNVYRRDELWCQQWIYEVGIWECYQAFRWRWHHGTLKAREGHCGSSPGLLWIFPGLWIKQSSTMQQLMHGLAWTKIPICYI